MKILHRQHRFHILWGNTPCINYMQYPWGYAVQVRICFTHESYHQYLWVISSVRMSHILSTGESYPQYFLGYALPLSMQYLWVILDGFGQASEIKCSKLVTKLVAVHLRQSLTLAVLKGLKVKTKYEPSSVIYSSKNSLQPMAGCRIN